MPDKELSDSTPAEYAKKKTIPPPYIVCEMRAFQSAMKMRFVEFSYSDSLWMVTRGRGEVCLVLHGGIV